MINDTSRDLTLIGDASGSILNDTNDLVQSEINYLLTGLKQQLDRLEPLISTRHPNCLLPLQMINANLELMSSQIKRSSSVFQNEQINNAAPPAVSSEETIRQVLTPPQPFKRTGVHKNYRLKVSGVMNSDEMISAQKKKIDDDQKAEEAKQKKKNQREVKKKIKQEKKDSAATRPRGRPRKSAIVVSDDDKETTVEPETLKKTRAIKRKAEKASKNVESKVKKLPKIVTDV